MNSVAVGSSLYWQAGEAGRRAVCREPRPPYATNYGHSNGRVQSAPTNGRLVYTMATRPLTLMRPSSAGIGADSYVMRHAPYAPRKNDSAGYTVGSYMKQCADGMLPNYSSLSDPHLREYYMRKFADVSRAHSRSQSAIQGKRSRPTSGQSIGGDSGAIYKVAVMTGDKKNAGTDARVYIRIKGTKGTLSKQALTKKTGSTRTTPAKKSRFKFRRGTTHVFKFHGKDIGEVVSLILEHDGLTKERSWYVEQVEVTKLVARTGRERSWIFVCQQWLSLHHGDCQVTRELFAKNYTKTEYEVVVVTGDVKGAGTDANVSLVVYGRTGQTARLQLSNKSKDCFERSRSDIFRLRSQCVGPMTKIRIEHDNTGFAAGWFLDRVVVTDLKTPKWKYYFPCCQWLAKDEGDGQICRDLAGSLDPLATRKSCKYKVTVYTGDKRGAGTDADVYVCLFGELGDSGERKLDSSRNNFEKNQADDFFVDCPNLGSLHRLRIGHDNSGPAPGWFLDKVIVDNIDQNRVFEFPCQRWLSKSEDDGQISRDLTCSGSPSDAPPGVPYTIHVTTGDVRQAGTSARVFIVLHGKAAATSGKIWLETGRFERGRTDIFTVDVAEQLVPLTHVDIGHDNGGAGAGWFLDKVMVSCSSAGYEQWFMCNKWLATGEGDGLIERTLHEERGLRKQHKKMTTWFVRIHTSDMRGAGTDANVFLVAYGRTKDGEYRKSDSVPLDNKGDNFESGQEDKFKVEMAEIGKPYKIRVGHDNGGSFAAWHLDRVELENMATKKKYEFKCRRWLATDEGDGSLVCELPAEGDTIKRPEPLVQYSVSVFTGKKRGAGTDANVFVEVFGEQGDTGPRALKSSKTNTNKFEKGNVDEFVLEAVTLKKLSKIRIGHDGSRVGSGWFLDKVVVRQVDDPKSDTVFECNRWLDVDEDDGQIVREITAGGSQMLSTTSYHVSVKTGDVFGAGTDANVFMKIFGEKGDTGLLQLKTSDSAKNKFERARTDLFKLEATDIGKIERIRIGHDGSNPGAGWFLDEVQCDVPSSGQRYVFACHRWLDKNEDDGQLEIELEPTSVEKGAVTIPYELTIWTEDKRGAGTDASVFVQMYGEDGKTEEFALRNRTDNFEQGQTDKFKIEAADVGRLLKIRVGHDGKGMFAGWFLDKILIQRKPHRGSARGQARRPSSARTIGRSSVDRDSSDRGSRSPSGVRRRSRLNDFDEDEASGTLGTRRRQRRRSVGPSDSEDDDRRRRSSTKRASSTSVGRRSDEDDDERRSRRRPASRAGRRERGEKGGAGEAGERGRKGGSDGKEVEEYWFVCRRWFAKGEDDGKIVRELLPTDEHGHVLETALKELEYTVTVFTGDVFGAGTDANVFVNVTGEYGDTGERQLDKSSHINKFERNQEDVFTISAVELGQLRKVKIRHDNKGGGAAWFLGHIEVEDPKTKTTYFFPCQRWLGVNEDDGQIARELLPVDRSLKRKLSEKDSTAIRKEVALETMAATTTYHVHVFTGDKFGAGTDANVYLHIHGTEGDTGTVFLKSSKKHRNKFERNQSDEFIVQAIDIGDIKKIKIGHDNAGGGGAWYLDRVEIDCPSLGKKWFFPCSRWLAKDMDDGKLERDLLPRSLETQQYVPYSSDGVPYEITTYTSDVSGAGTDADVSVTLYGRTTCTAQKSLCPIKRERKAMFERKAVDKFVLEMEDVGDTIEKIRIGHDGSGFGAGWHLDKVEVRRLKDTGKGSETYSFPCGRWLASGEDDGAIVRELVADTVLDETMKSDGSLKRKQKTRKDTLVARTYAVSVFTGEVKGAGTDANVFLTVFGDRGDSGERKLAKSETHRDKFEKGQEDKFALEAVDLGQLFKVKVRHDNSMFSPAWFLDRVEVRADDGRVVTFHCERWLGKNKDDGKIERTLYVKGYEGDMSSTSTLQTHRHGSVGSLDSLRSSEPFSHSPRTNRRHLEEIPEGPTIAYTVKVTTGGDRDMGTDADVWVKVKGTQRRHTGKLYLELAQRRAFEPGSVETFSLEAVDVDDVKQIEIGHDGAAPESGWFVKEVELDMPTKGRHYFFHCAAWLSREHGDGRTSRTFSVNQSDSATTASYKPMVPYEVTIHTGDKQNAGTDSQVFLKAFGANGATSDVVVEKLSERFERGRADLIKMELEDVAPLKKLRIGHDGKGDRPEWFLEKVEMRNMDTGDLSVFKANCWLSKSCEDQKIVRDIPATVRGKVQLKPTTYRVEVKTSDVRGAGTSANVSLVLFGEHGDSDELRLRDREAGGSAFESGQVDVFVFPHLLSLGQLTKARVWHDNKGFGSAWHLTHIEVEDCGTKQRYIFPCNRWLSKTDDDKQIYRELTCASPSSPGGKEKVAYEIEVTTADKKDAGIIHNAWLILEGAQRSSKVFFMENSAKHKVLRRGQTDIFTLTSRNLGQLERCILGAVEREDRRLDDYDGADASWFCHQVAVTNKSTGDRYTFLCKSWIQIFPEASRRNAKTLEVKKIEESKTTVVKNLGTVKYEVIVVTGDVKGAGTDANVSITIYGDNGDTGKRPLQQKMRNLFERKQTDKFTLEAVELGALHKIRIEHDNAGFGAGWLLDHVEVCNMATDHRWTFPCGQWLDKKRGDGQTGRELMCRD